jgi:hypothetical protein
MAMTWILTDARKADALEAVADLWGVEGYEFPEEESLYEAVYAHACYADACGLVPMVAYRRGDMIPATDWRQGDRPWWWDEDDYYELIEVGTVLVDLARFIDEEEL